MCLLLVCAHECVTFVPLKQKTEDLLFLEMMTGDKAIFRCCGKRGVEI